jgi:hypothetical protein
MLVWATEFPVKDGASMDDLLRLVKKWLLGTKNSVWKPEMFTEEPIGEITTYKQAGQEFSIARLRMGTESWVGARLQWIEDNQRNWALEFGAHQMPKGLIISIQNHCDLLRVGLGMPISKKPYIVKQLLEEIGGGIDCGLAISDRPIHLPETAVDLAAKIVTGNLGNYLPVIYASASWDGRPSIDAEKLAKWTSGMAHVVVEPSRTFSFQLAEKTSRNNAYGGAVSIYWPGGVGRQSRLLVDKFPSVDKLEVAVADLLKKALANNRPTADCTWDFIRDSIVSSKFETLKASGSKNLEDYISNFDIEIAAKNERINKVEGEINRLRMELERANTAADIDSEGILTPGKERSFHAGEIRDTVIKALKIARNQLFADGRGQNILDDLLHSNTQGDEEKKISDEIKRALSEKDLSKSGRKILENIGFSFSDDGKHIKALYHEDPRYSFTFQKTGSDWRGMKNQASDICKTLFK